MSAKDDARKVMDAAAKLERGQAMIDAKLQETAWEDQELLREYGEMFGETQGRAREYQEAMNRQHLRNLQSDPVLMEELRAQGMTAAQYVAKMNEDPNAFPEIYREGVKKIVTRAKSGPKTGGDPFFNPGRSARPTAAQSAKAKAAAKKGRGTDADMDKVLGALMGFDD
jgi:hypothetical protein